MRSVVIFFIAILSFQNLASAQERDTLFESAAPDRSANLPEYDGMQMSRGSSAMPALSAELRSSAGFQNSALTNMNFNPLNGWKSEMFPITGIGSINRFPFWNHPIILNRWSSWDVYQGSYWFRTYQVNDKFYIGTSGFSDKNFNVYLQKSGYLRQTNYNSSMFVGYKFSEKFSISAGFTISNNGDPLIRNKQMQNGGIFP